MPAFIGILLAALFIVFFIAMLAYVLFYAAVIGGVIWASVKIIAACLNAVVERNERREEEIQQQARRAWERALAKMDPATAWMVAIGDAPAPGPRLEDVGGLPVADIREIQRCNHKVHTALSRLVELRRSGLAGLRDVRLRKVFREVEAALHQRARLVKQLRRTPIEVAHPALHQLADGPEWRLAARLLDLEGSDNPDSPAARAALEDLAALVELTLDRHPDPAPVRQREVEAGTDKSEAGAIAGRTAR